MLMGACLWKGYWDPGLVPASQLLGGKWLLCPRVLSGCIVLLLPPKRFGSVIMNQKL